MRINKKILFILIFTLFLTNSCFSATRNIGDPFKLIYNIVDASGNHVGSQTVVLSIQKASNGYWYDFSDSTFKASGWSNKTTNLSEDATNGLYSYTFTPPASETSAEEYVFLINNDDSAYGDHQALAITYQNIGTSDWTTNEKIEFKTILGVTGTGTPDDTPSDGALKEIQDKMPTPYDIGP